MGVVHNTCCNGNERNPEVPNTTMRCDPSSEWATAVFEGNLDDIKSIYNQKAKVLNSRINTEGDTAMHIAVRRKHMKLIEFLLSQDADVNIKSLKTGNTALHEGALKDNIYILTMLIHYGADPKILNKEGKSPKSLGTDRQIKAIFKNANIERIRNQRSLKQLLETPTALFNEDKNQMLQRQNSDSFTTTALSSTLPSGREFSFNESYMGKIADVDQGIFYFYALFFCFLWTAEYINLFICIF